MKILVKFAICLPLRCRIERHQPRPAAQSQKPPRQRRRRHRLHRRRGTGGAPHPPPPGWNARCTSASRGAPLECAIEQTAVLTKTGQLIVLVNIRVPADTRAPVALVQLPLGLNLPAGAKVQVDDGKMTDLQIQTCEARGCYADFQISPDAAGRAEIRQAAEGLVPESGKETITIPMPLTDFAAAYDKIK